MNAVFSILILIAVIGLIIFLLSRRENTRTRNVTNKGALQHEGIQA